MQRMIKSTMSENCVVFTTSAFSLPLIDLLVCEKKLVGVILPDPNELPTCAAEINNLAGRLQQAGIPYQMCCEEKLPLIVRQLDAWQAELGLIAAYPHILPAQVIDYFSLGLFNLHASLLPAYPGPMPIYWQIRNRESETGLVIHRAEIKPDTGNIVVTRKLPIHPLDTVSSLSNQLSYTAREAVAELIAFIEANGVSPVGEKQTVSKRNVPNLPGVEYAQRPTAEDGAIDFTLMRAEEISALCRAGSGQPFAASLVIRGVPMTLLQSTAVEYPTYGTQAGTVIFVGEPEGLIISVKGGALRLDILAGTEGVYGGLAFAERFQIDPGMQLQSPLVAGQSSRQRVTQSTVKQAVIQ